MWNVDIDKLTYPFTPRNRVFLLPKPISHFLGYRNQAVKELGNVIVAAWALVGALVGIAVVAASSMIPEIQNHTPPVVIASFVGSTSSDSSDLHLHFTGCCSHLTI